MTRKIRGIAFDAFGTLVTSVRRDGPYQRLAKAAAVDPRQFRIDVMTRNIGLAEMARDLGQEHMADELSSALVAELDTVALYPEVAECLSHLDREDVPYVICSNLGHGYGRRVMDLVPNARGYVMSYEVGAFKPDPKMYAAVTDMLGISASEVFFTGDTMKADFEGPVAFGMQSAHLDRKSGDDLRSVVMRALSDATGASIFYG
jgi:HAD superfamily hydrolase (TIGR01549 family)